MAEFIVREAVLADAEGIARIHVEMWQHAYRGQMPDALLDGLTVEQRLPMHVQRLTTPPARAHTLVADDGEQILGFCTVGTSHEPDASEDTGHLYAIYLDPAVQGKGIGSALLDEGVRQLRAEGFTEATLWVLATNTPTILFYERKGWVADGSTKTELWNDVPLNVVRYAIDLR